jgi:hypothetical protein
MVAAALVAGDVIISIVLNLLRRVRCFPGFKSEIYTWLLALFAVERLPHRHWHVRFRSVAGLARSAFASSLRKFEPDCDNLDIEKYSQNAPMRT